MKRHISHKIRTSHPYKSPEWSQANAEKRRNQVSGACLETINEDLDDANREMFGSDFDAFGLEDIGNK